MSLSPLSIHWFLQPLSAHPELLSPEAAAKLLTATEQEKFGAIKTRQRQREWLLGRQTLKELLRRATGRETPLDQIHTDYDDSGAPTTTFPALNGYPFRVSISHSHGYAFCAAVSSEAGTVGADVEHIAARAPDFASSFFTEQEQAHLHPAADRHYDMFLTAIWSAKEATLKALGSGWWRNTGLVSCLPNPQLSPPGVWNRFQIIWHPDHQTAGPTELPELSGWWRVSSGFILALASHPAAEPTQLGAT
jgi:phosphopantetheinyl transferase